MNLMVVLFSSFALLFLVSCGKSNVAVSTIPSPKEIPRFVPTDLPRAEVCAALTGKWTGPCSLEGEALATSKHRRTVTFKFADCASFELDEKKYFIGVPKPEIGEKWELRPGVYQQDSHVRLFTWKMSDGALWANTVTASRLYGATRNSEAFKNMTDIQDSFFESTGSETYQLLGNKLRYELKMEITQVGLVSEKNQRRAESPYFCELEKR